ncbi:hypothetical protein VTO73DRAFT_824 [Trametes versicolor]
MSTPRKVSRTGLDWGISGDGAVTSWKPRGASSLLLNVTIPSRVLYHPHALYAHVTPRMMSSRSINGFRFVLH